MRSGAGVDEADVSSVRLAVRVLVTVSVGDVEGVMLLVDVMLPVLDDVGVILLVGVMLLVDVMVDVALNDTEAVREAVADGVTAWQTSPIPSPLSRGTASVLFGQLSTHEPLPAGQIPLRMAGLGSSVGGSSA